MLRLVQKSPALLRRAAVNLPTRRTLSSSSQSSSSSSSLLAGDVGRKATHIHHHFTTLLAVTFPAYLLVPNSYEDSAIDKSLGLLVSGAIAAHSWIGMNYVATDYVPKISKGLVGPARGFNALLAGVTLMGMAKVSLNGKGGARGAVKALWRPLKKE